jgi:hypothetical protein
MLPLRTTRIGLLEVTERHESFLLPEGGEPASVSLDPNAWGLGMATFAKKEQ